MNERWLDRYRSWVYGAGFGWQIGVGLATYIMTSALYLLILIGGLTAEPVVAIALGALFGLVRGLAVYLAAGLDSTERLLSFHSKFESHREAVRQSTIVIMAAVSVAAVAAAGATATVLGAVVVLGGLGRDAEPARTPRGRLPERGRCPTRQLDRPHPTPSCFGRQHPNAQEKSPRFVAGGS